MEEGTARRFTCLSSASLMRFRSSPAPPAAPSPKKTTIQLATLLLRLPRWPPVHAGSANGEARARVRVRARKRGEEHGRGSGPGAAAGAAPASGEVCKLGRIPDTELQARGSNRNRTQQLPPIYIRRLRRRLTVGSGTAEEFESGPPTDLLLHP